MALGRQGERQSELMVTWAEMPRSPGHVFYDRLQEVLVADDFDRHFPDNRQMDSDSTQFSPSLEMYHLRSRLTMLLGELADQ